MRYLSICVLLSLLLCGSIFGRQQKSSVPPDTAAAAPALSVNAADQGPVPVPEPSEKALRYYRTGNIIWVFNLLWGLLIPALFLFTGFSAKIRDWASRLGKKWFFIIGIYFLIFLIINVLIDLPISYYTEFVRQHAYGLSNQTLGKWFGDLLKGMMVSAIIGFLFLWLPYLLLKKSPKRWWLYTGLLAIPFLVLTILISPIWIAPLFNKF